MKYKRIFLTCILTIALNIELGVCGTNDIVIKEISFENKGAVLSGIIALPVGDGRFPGVVYVHGAGPEKRQSFYAHYFAKRGIAFLTFDKRSYGESTGSFFPGSNVSLENLKLKASDVSKAIEYLKGFRQVEPSGIGLFGFSQAGWVAPLAASINQDISYMAIVSGGTMTTGEELEYSSITREQREFFKNHTRKEVDLIESKLMKSGYDPFPIMKSIEAKALWLYGENDESLPVSIAISNLEVLKSKYNKDYTIKLFLNRDHSLRLENEKFGPPNFINEFIVNWISENATQTKQEGRR